MAITGGFGMTMDLERGTMRQWVMGRDGVKRWADNGQPVKCACGIGPMGITTKLRRRLKAGRLGRLVRGL